MRAFQIGPNHTGFNLDRSEEILLVDAWLKIRGRLGNDEHWAAEFEAFFFDNDKGLSEKYLNAINRCLSRLRLPNLHFVPSDWTPYMRLRGDDKIQARFRIRQEMLNLNDRERMLTEARDAAMNLPKAPMEEEERVDPELERRRRVEDAIGRIAAATEQQRMDHAEQKPVIDRVSESAPIATAVALAQKPVAANPALPEPSAPAVAQAPNTSTGLFGALDIFLQDLRRDSTSQTQAIGNLETMVKVLAEEVVGLRQLILDGVDKIRAGGVVADETSLETTVETKYRVRRQATQLHLPSNQAGRLGDASSGSSSGFPYPRSRYAAKSDI